MIFGCHLWRDSPMISLVTVSLMKISSESPYLWLKEIVIHNKPNIILFINSLRPSDAYICISKLTIIGSDNGLSPGRRQTIIWINVGILFIGTIGTNFSETLIEIYTFSFEKMPLKMLSGKWQPFCLGLNVLIHVVQHTIPTRSLHCIRTRADTKFIKSQNWFPNVSVVRTAYQSRCEWVYTAWHGLRCDAWWWFPPHSTKHTSRSRSRSNICSDARGSWPSYRSHSSHLVGETEITVNHHRMQFQILRCINMKKKSL